MALSRLQLNKAVQFLLAGNARIVVRNLEPKNPNRAQFGFTVKYYPEKKFYRVFYYDASLGIIWPSTKVFTPSKFTAQFNQEQLQAGAVFEYVWKRLKYPGSFPSSILLYHAGECGKCRRPLSDPLSIALGIGPECRAQLGIHLTKPQIDEILQIAEAL